MATENCVCCLNTEKLLDIFDDYKCEGKSENYCAMLKQALDIEIPKGSNAYNMCLDCIVKLRDAYYFREKCLNTMKSLHIAIGTKTCQETVNLDYLDEEEIQEEIGLNKTKKDLYPKSSLVSDKSNKKSDYMCKINKIFISNENIKSILKSNGILKKYCGSDITFKGVQFDNKQTNRNPYIIDLDQTTCYICEAEFICNDNLLVHMKSEHFIFICDFCGIELPSSKQLTRHKRNHDKGPFACATCNKEFSNINTLNTHTWRLHTHKHPFACSECGVRFPTYHQRARHHRTVHGLDEMRYMCPHCNKGFYDAGARSKHIRFTHLRERPYKCDRCVKEFCKRSFLQSHYVNVHKIGEKRFKCELCEKRFSYKATLEYHMKNHDKIDIERFPCKLCDTMFLSEANLKNHVINSHDLIMNFKTS